MHTENNCYRKKNSGGKGGGKGSKGGKGKGGKSAGAGPSVDSRMKKPCTYQQCKGNRSNHFMFQCPDYMKKQLKQSNSGSDSD